MKNKMTVVILISIILVASFMALAYCGFRHSRGVPSIVEEPKKVTLEVPFIDKDIDLSKDISLDVWNSITSKEIELIYQVMVLPWGKSSAPLPFGMVQKVIGVVENPFQIG